MIDTVLLVGAAMSPDIAYGDRTAIAISGGRIAAIGDSGAVLREAAPRTEVVDLRDATVVPGFIDTHQHTSHAAFEPVQIDCSTPPLESVADVLEEIRRDIAAVPRGGWIRAWGFNAGKVREGRNPTRRELDDVAPDNPLLLIDLSFHAGYVNTAALRALGISRDTPDPRHGEITRDRHGQPTGELLEGAIDEAQLASWKAIAADSAVALDLLEAYCRRLLSLGITAVGDALVTPDGAVLYEHAAAAGRLPLTVQQMHGGRAFFARPVVGAEMAAETLPRLRGNTVKLFMDKVHPSGPAITLRGESSVPIDLGSTYYSVSELEELAQRAVSLGIVPATHAIGNRAIAHVLEAYARVRKALPARDTPLRLEHFSLGTVEQVQRAAGLGVVVSTQPILAYSWGDAFMDWRRGERAIRVLPLRSLTDAGVVVAGGSDYPCDKLPPLLGMWAAVSRRSESGAPVDPEEGVTALEALRMYTVNAAIASGRQDEEGSIAVGKRANLVALDGNPLDCATDALRDLTVLRTYVDGQCVFEREAPSAGP